MLLQVLIPIPQYPLYTAALALFNGRPIPYYLDEDAQWSASVRAQRVPHPQLASTHTAGTCWRTESDFGCPACAASAHRCPWCGQAAMMEESVTRARAQGTDVRAIVVINPGNPTGQCLPLENMREVWILVHAGIACAIAAAHWGRRRDATRW